MNVEKYGYTLLNVVTIDAVQLIIVKMDTEAPEHKGKAPRIIFSFRGTANLTNAKYDLNIHRVVWREMARAARQEKKRENKPENEEDSEEELNEHEKKKKKNKKKEEARQEDAEEDAELQEVLSMATGRELNDSISSAATLASQLLAGEHNNNNNNGIHEPGAGGSALLGCRSCLQSCVDRTSFQPAVHAGFLALWKSFRPYVMKELKKLATRDSDGHNSANTNHNNNHNVYRFFTTGHSLGAALASLCAYSMTLYLERIKYPLSEVTVYSYGQPRMGNKVFCGLYNKKVPRSFRVFNESDIVVTMTMFGSYHIGLEVNIDRHGNYIIKPTEIEKMFPPDEGTWAGGVEPLDGELWRLDECDCR
ncbi:hypothetical protein AGDE_15998 [Angomonas deanei]|nr:hypothetical protein AGDE_15998 [Angomonas deanei]|eukprot:EPY17946.1 hypothetical protein AGDE_15998 [Angomonas deanei]